MEYWIDGVMDWWEGHVVRVALFVRFCIGFAEQNFFAQLFAMYANVTVLQVSATGSCTLKAFFRQCRQCSQWSIRPGATNLVTFDAMKTRQQFSSIFISTNENAPDESTRKRPKGRKASAGGRKNRRYNGHASESRMNGTQ
jgi:hypothetical protein